MAGPWEKFSQTPELKDDPVAQEIVQGPKPWEKFDPTKPKEEGPSGLLRGFVGALPAVGGIAGGIAGSALGPAGTLGGGALGAAGGKALQNFIEEQGFGEKKVDPNDSLLDRTRTRFYEPSKEAALEVSAPLIAKTVATPFKYAGEKAAGYLSRFAQPAKEGAEEIAASAERLGTKATPGMLTDNKLIGGIESATAQSPTAVGQQYGKNYEDISRVLKQTGEDILSPGKTASSPLQLAGSAKSDITSSIAEKIAPAQMIYEDLAKDGKFIDVNPESVKRISKNILNLDTASLKGTPENSFAKMVADNLEATPNLQKLRSLKTYVGKVSGDAQATPQMRSAAGDIYGRLSQLEKNSITRSALAAAKNPQHGKAVAQDMIAELKGANKIYSDVSKSLKDLAEKSGMGKVRNYSDFIQKIEKIPDEKFVSKMFQQGNNSQLKEFQRQFPQAYDKMKTSYMADLYNKSITKGEVSIPKLLSQAKKLPIETQKLIFGEGSSQSLKDMENVYNAFPNKIGPSGTPQGLEFSQLNIVSPKYWYNELRDKTNDMLLKNPEFFKRFKPKEAVKETGMGLLKKGQGLLIPTRAIENAGDSQ